MAAVTSAYDALGVAGGAAPEAVRRAYLRAVASAHPDRARFAPCVLLAQAH
jgi:DnaJ-class molecular chaperone